MEKECRGTLQNDREVQYTLTQEQERIDFMLNFIDMLYIGREDITAKPLPVS
jgi:hypothetical protein